jgi:hypothetical protein
MINGFACPTTKPKDLRFYAEARWHDAPRTGITAHIINAGGNGFLQLARNRRLARQPRDAGSEHREEA